MSVKEGCDVAHMMKHTKASCGHMFAHFDRKAEHISNENLDRTRTHLNYNLATHQQMDQGEFVRQRCSEVHCQNRKDINVMVSWVITAPKDLPEAEHKAFFQACYDFCKKRYGLENVVSAYVHMDEVTPHMHFAFVPVVRTFKQNRKNPNISIEWDKVSAKECVNRYDLQSFHTDLQKYVQRELGHEVNILNEATKEGNKSIEELKRKSATERLQEANIEASKIVSEAQKDIKVLQQQKKALQEQIEGLQRDILTSKQVKEVPHSKALIGDKQLVSTADFEALCKTAATAEELLKEIKPARKLNAKVQTILQTAQSKADEIIKQAEYKANSMAERLESIKYKKKLEHIENVINSDKNLVGAFQEAERNFAEKQKHRTRSIEHGLEQVEQNIDHGFER